MKIARYLALIICFAVILSACDTTPLIPAPQVRLRSWIDAPLNGMQLPLAPYQVVFHITDADKVVSGELTINGSVVAEIPNPEEGTNYAALTYNWIPIDYGIYTLATRAKGAEGDWGDYAQVVVEIVKPTATFTPTDVHTPTITVTMTMTPTGSETPTLTPTLTPTILAGFISVSASPSAVYSGNCTPNQLTISAQTTQTTGITAVILFYRLRDSDSTTEWLNTAMNPLGAGQYSKSINVASAASQLGSSNQSGMLDYQLVIQQQNGDLIRSQLYSNVEVAACGSRLPNLEINPIIPIPLIKTAEFVK